MLTGIYTRNKGLSVRCIRHLKLIHDRLFVIEIRNEGMRIDQRR